MSDSILGNQSYMSTLGADARAWMGERPAQMLPAVTVVESRVWNWKAIILLVLALIVWVIVGKGSNRRRR